MNQISKALTNKKILIAGFTLIAALLSVALYFGFQVIGITKFEMIKAHSFATATELQGLVGHHLEPGYLDEPLAGRRYAKLRKHIEEGTAQSDIVEMRIWDVTGAELLFSTDASELGVRSEAPPERIEALHGNVLHYSVVDVPEGNTRSRFNGLLEVHMPLTVDGEPVGIYEIYLTTDGVNKLFSSLTMGLIAATGLVFLSMVLVGLAALGLSRRNDALVDLSAHLSRRADTDSLTGLFNHRHFHSFLQEQVERGDRYGEQLSLIMLDLDHFKAINDCCGHKAGDRALLMLADSFRRVLRGIDYAARYGGDEFVVVLPNTGAQDGLAAAERLRREVAGIDLGVTDNLGRPVKLSISCGLADFPICSADRETLIAMADQALLYAKDHGRDQVCYFKEIREHAS